MSDGRLTVGSLFSGIGLLDYGLHLAGFEHAWLCEQDEWRQGILRQRFPGAAVHGDVRDAHVGWGRVDLVAGGFPCKGISSAGKRQGFGHPESVLWREMARAVRELRPRYVLVENVDDILGMHDGDIWAEVLGDLAASGYDVAWDVLPAGAVGAPHLRQRVFAVAAHTHGSELEGHGRPLGVQEEVARTAALHAATTPDAADIGHERGRPARSGRDGSADGGDVASDSERQPPELRRGHGTVHGPAGDVEGAPRERQRDRVAAGGGGEAVADAESGRAGHDGTDAAGRLGAEPHGVAGVPVEWGEYEPAIRRWEAVHGPAPEPLVRGVDARPAARVVRSRLSALGDGVQVQCGYLAGRHIIELERQRMSVAA